MDVYWKNEKTDSLGRNGWTITIGLNIYAAELEETVELTPINSKDNGARCHIRIPREDVPEVIRKLEEAYQTEKFFEKGNK